MLDVEPDPVTVLELGAEARLGDPRFHLARAVLDVIEAPAEGELPHRANRSGPGTVLARGERAPEVVAAQEANFRVEVVADAQVVDLEGVEVSVVGEDSLVASVVAVEAGRLAAGAAAPIS